MAEKINKWEFLSLSKQISAGYEPVAQVFSPTPSIIDKLKLLFTGQKAKQQ